MLSVPYALNAGNGNFNKTGNDIYNSNSGRVGIGTKTPESLLNLVSAPTDPFIPGTTSNGVLRIGISDKEGIDIGKMGSSPYAGWMQVGYNNIFSDPLSLQPLGGNVGIGTTTPATSSILDVTSTTKGLLPPRMTASQRDVISNPVTGLIVYCTNCGIYAGELQVYNGFSWRSLSGQPATIPFAVGQAYQGGVIAYILQTGDPGYDPNVLHGLIAALSDQGSFAWGCSGDLTGASGTAIGTGGLNTLFIVTFCLFGASAAAASDAYSVGIYNDWFLPSSDELYKLYLNRSIIGGFSGALYWSSSEFIGSPTTHANTVLFSNGLQSNSNKSSLHSVRPVRYF